MKHRVIASHSYQCFQTGIASFLQQHKNGEVLILGASRGAADDTVYAAAPGGLLGAHRLTIAQAAAVLAAPVLAERQLKVANHFAAEAVAARVVHELRERGAWTYFGPVAGTPGFAHALATTVAELRLESVSAEAIVEAEEAAAESPHHDLAVALREFAGQLAAGSMADMADIFEMAIASAQRGDHRFAGMPVLLLDVTLRSELARRFVSKLVERSPHVVACALASDKDGIAFFEQLLGVPASLAPDEAGAGTIGRVRSWIFAITQPRGEAPDETLDYFSAPGEAMECVEIARRIVKLAAKGVPFDRIAVLLRAPERYQPLLEEALRRADIPRYFSRGVVRPDPAGRAFLALLECAMEDCSASRFAEYLSLGQAPQAGQVQEEAIPVESEIQAALRGEGVEEAAQEREPDDGSCDDDTVVAGTLQAPLQWEHLLIDASVIGGAERWERRLKALASELHLKLEHSEDSAADHAHYQRELDRLANLQAFALPLIEQLCELPASAYWAEWLQELRELAKRSLRRPGSVLAVLDELEPMADVGPVRLEEVAIVLSDRLRFLRREPPARRSGCVFVAGIDEARGRVFDAVFLPGLAEGVFPRKVAEDPLLLDFYREKISTTLITNRQRREHERVLLSIAVATPAKQFTFSYPRVDLAQSRPRVPSFYALEVIRAANGYLPELRAFQQQAAERAPSRLDRLAPLEFADAIDNAEYDLVAMSRALPAKGNAQPGAMAYLMKVSETLARSLRARYSRWETKSKWTMYDGLVSVDSDLASTLAAYRLPARPYSPTALQAFAACPYRFALLGIQGLRPRDTIQPLNQMDPLTRGALFHDAQREFFEQAQAADLIPVGANMDDCRDLLDEALDEIAETYRDRLAPAIMRVWRAEVEDIRTDLHGWLQQIAGESEWIPEHYEYGFGLRNREGRDRDSAAEPVTLPTGARLRGAIDLIERHAKRGTLRVVDHKTGKAPERRSLIVGGGASLQPMLYALAAEKRLGVTVESGRLSFCTQRGNYQTYDVPVTADTRLRIERVLEIIDSAIASGNLPAAPDKGVCSFCDCRAVCGPHEQMRWHRKTVTLDDLDELRRMP